MTDSLPPLPELGPEWTPYWTKKVHEQMQNYARAAIAQAQSCVPAVQDAANLLSRLERQWHRMGELWERCQGKGWPEKEGAEFNTLRDEKAPATRGALLAMLAASPKPQPVQPTPLSRRCYLMSESHLSGHRLIIGFERLEDVQDAHAFLAAPQPKD